MPTAHKDIHAQTSALPARRPCEAPITPAPQAGTGLDAPELELLSSESESEDDELLSSESDEDEEELLSESDEDASRFLRFLEPFFLSSSAPAAAPCASGSSSLGSRNRGRACRNNSRKAGA